MAENTPTTVAEQTVTLEIPEKTMDILDDLFSLQVVYEQSDRPEFNLEALHEALTAKAKLEIRDAIRVYKTAVDLEARKQPDESRSTVELQYIRRGKGKDLRKMAEAAVTIANSYGIDAKLSE